MRFMRVICFCVCFFCIPLVAHSEDNDSKKINLINEIIETTCFDESEYISRKDSLVVIMRIAGLDATTVYTTAHYCLLEKRIFDDADYFHNEKYTIIRYAGVYGIAKGTKEGTLNMFHPEKTITLKEVCAFILRCLNGTESVSWNDIQEQAIQHGILDCVEYSEMSWNAPCSKDVFKKLLYNFVNKKRHLYWTKGDSDDGIITGEIIADKEKMVNYYEWYVSLPDMDKRFFSIKECPHCQ